ncbi:MAG: nuclear transport factor 2 family protein [Pseudoflavonifractor sp.]
MTNTEVERVRSVVQRYIDCTYKADIPGLKSCFHSAARMTGYLGDTLLVGTPDPFFEDMGSEASMESKGDPYKAEIRALTVTGRIAEAVVYETGFRGNGVLEDHFQLLNDGGVWSIIAKNFTTI